MSVTSVTTGAYEVANDHRNDGQFGYAVVMRLVPQLTRASLLALFLAAIVPSSGCSYLFVTPPHETYGGHVANCTTNRAAPVIDTIFVGTNVISALYVAGEDNVTNKGSSVALGLGVAALWLSSAIYGYYNTSQCEELRSQEASGPYYPPPRPVRRPAWQQQPPPPAYAPPPAAPAQLPPPDWPPQQPPPAPAAAPAPDATAPPPPPAAAPARPQQQDDDDPHARRTGPAPGRPDSSPHFGN